MSRSPDVSRREFLSAACGLVAVSSLPSLAADDPGLFPSRGRCERLVLAYQHVPIGIPKPFSVLHISDTHLTETYDSEPETLRKFCARRRKTFGGRQQEALRDSLAWAKDNVDYVLHTGDMIDFQSEANFDLVRRFYGDAAGRIFGSTGNHEYQLRAEGKPVGTTVEYNAKGRGALSKAFPFDTVFDSVVVNGVNFVSMEQVYGVVTAEQATRFQAEAKKGLPIVLCMHAPFYTNHIRRATRKFWSRKGRRFTTADLPELRGGAKRQAEDAVTRDFLSYLRGEPLLKAILAGHLHITVQDRFSPTAMEYVVGGNFLLHGQEILFS